MAADDERAMLRDARGRLDEWVWEARVEAYESVFEGEDALVTGDELRALDEVDSALSRQGRGGIWGTDEYGVLSASALGDLTDPRVVCVYRPEVPEDVVHHGPGGLDDETEERLNEAIWEYCERVADHAQERLEEYLAGRAE